VFETVLNENSDGLIQIDDVRVNTHESCALDASCSFEDSLCNWTPYGSNSFNFLRIAPQQLQTIDKASANTDLATDTTLKSKYGKFLWMGADYYNDLASTSMLISDTLLASSFKTREGCFTFMYFMSGPNASSLNVYERSHGTKGLNSKWSLTGDQGSAWKMARIPFQSITSNFDLVLETSLNTRNANVPTIAIDDLFFSKSDCTNIATTPSPSKVFDCGDNTTIVESKVCDFIRDCGTGLDETNCADCDFEMSTCRWVESSTGDLQWQRIQAGRSKATGPQVDNTKKTGYGWYMFADTRNGNYYFDDAHLILNRDLRPSSTTCEIEFYYYLKDSYDSINVIVLVNYPDSIETKVFSAQSSFEKDWKRGLVRLGRISQPFRIMFSGKMSTDQYDGYIGIDDVRLVNCQFPLGTILFAN
jgi:hypothetical protein